MSSLYRVGELYDARRTSWPEAVDYNYRESGAHEMRMFLPKPSGKEIQSITRGPSEFALVVSQPIIFLLYRFLPALPTWSDTPYSIHLVRQGLGEMPPLPPAPATPETRATLSIVLVDAQSGIVRGLRLVTLSHDFTDKLHAAIREQAATEWDERAYDAHLQRYYANHTTTTQMLDDAVARCDGGS